MDCAGQNTDPFACQCSLVSHHARHTTHVRMQSCIDTPRADIALSFCQFFMPTGMSTLDHDSKPLEQQGVGQELALLILTLRFLRLTEARFDACILVGHGRHDYVDILWERAHHPHVLKVVGC
jgi:hypothetical protein